MATLLVTHQKKGASEGGTPAAARSSALARLEVARDMLAKGSRYAGLLGEKEGAGQVAGGEEAAPASTSVSLAKEAKLGDRAEEVQVPYSIQPMGLQQQE